MSASARGFKLYAYALPTGALPATPPPSSFIGYYNVAAGSPLCGNVSSGRRCVIKARVPVGRDGISAIVYDHYPSPPPNPSPTPSMTPPPSNNALASATAIVTIKPSTVGVAFTFGGIPASFDISAPALNDTGSSAANFTIGVAASDADGNIIMTDTYANPIVVGVYGPPGSISAPKGTIVRGAPSLLLRQPAATAAFHYSGQSFINPMTVTVVDGRWSATTQVFSAATPAPSACPATIASTTVYPIPQESPLAFGSSGGFRLNVSMGGVNLGGMQIDTGSTGVLISRSLLPSRLPTSFVGPGQFGEELLLPSHVTEEGHYYLVPVTISNLQNKRLGTTVPMEVLVVDWLCSPQTGCQEDTGTKYIGVGFGRPTPAPGTGYLKGPLENAFLQLKAVVQGSMHPGFLLSSTTMNVGLNASELAGYSFTQLTPFVGRTGDWNGPTGCVAFNGGAYQCGSLLVDVGINTMFITANVPQPTSTALNQVSVAAPSSSNPPLEYSFPYPVPANATPPAPNPHSSSATIGFTQSVTATPFVNTGRSALAASSYVYDAGCGRVGFQPL